MNLVKVLSSFGFNYHGTEVLYSGTLGTELTCELFIGPVYYQQLRHMVSDKFQVIALTLPHRPLFPGFYTPIYMKGPKLLALLAENCKRSASYVGAFLVKDEPGSDSTLISGSETEKSIYELKGEALYK